MKTTMKNFGQAGALAVALASLSAHGRVIRDHNAANPIAYKKWAPHSSPCWSDQNPGNVRSLDWPDGQYLNTANMTVETCLDDVSTNSICASPQYTICL